LDGCELSDLHDRDLSWCFPSSSSRGTWGLYWKVAICCRSPTTSQKQKTVRLVGALAGEAGGLCEPWVVEAFWVGSWVGFVAIVRGLASSHHTDGRVGREWFSKASKGGLRSRQLTAVLITATGSVAGSVWMHNTLEYPRQARSVICRRTHLRRLGAQCSRLVARRLRCRPQTDVRLVAPSPQRGSQTQDALQEDVRGEASGRWCGSVVLVEPQWPRALL
jgi:hypothetical protein